jgi:N-acetyllactosaminide beta-1,3-N-acetylglucosaminyltransferase
MNKLQVTFLFLKKQIRIYDWVWTGYKWAELKKSFSICLSTQGSLDRLYWLPQLVESWRGPVSLAVFIASPQEWIGLNVIINHFRKCYPIFANFVSVHLAIPFQVEDWTDDFHGLKEDIQNFEFYPCREEPENIVQQVVKRFQVNEEAKKMMENYPQNHMRNLARNGCGSEYTFSTDIDIIPRQDSATLLQDFINTDYAKNCTR